MEFDIEDDCMDKLSQKLHFDIDKFRSMNPADRKELQKVILEYQLKVEAGKEDPFEQVGSPARHRFEDIDFSKT